MTCFRRLLSSPGAHIIGIISGVNPQSLCMQTHNDNEYFGFCLEMLRFFELQSLLKWVLLWQAFYWCFLFPGPGVGLPHCCRGEAQCPLHVEGREAGGVVGSRWGSLALRWHCAVSAQQTALGRRLVSGFQKEAWRAQPPGWRLDLSKKPVGKGCGAGPCCVPDLYLKVLKLPLHLIKLWWIDVLVSTYLCPNWHVIGKGHDCWTAEIKTFRATYGKKAEKFCYGLKRCVPFLYIYWEIMLLPTIMFFTDILRNFYLSYCHF